VTSSADRALAAIEIPNGKLDGVSKTMAEARNSKRIGELWTNNPRAAIENVDASVEK